MGSAVERGDKALQKAPTLYVHVFALALLSTTVCAREKGGVRFMEPYAVEGLGVGAPVVPGSWQYRRYKCQPSEQYQSSIVCRFNEMKDGASNAITILHLYNNIVTYINKSVSPAFFTRQEIERELARLSTQFGNAPQIRMSRAGVIATWGDIELQPLHPRALSALAGGDNPKLGFLVDYLMNFHQSAREGLPVYRLAGGKGFVWVARFARPGQNGMLRFLAADPSRMEQTSAQFHPVGEEPAEPPPPAPGGSRVPEPESKQDATSWGSGFFISASGSVVTNAHVVEGCDRPWIIAGSGAPEPARVLARDSANDLALLKSEIKPPSTASLRAGVRIGEEIAVFGYPLVGLLSTKGNFTVGNVSALAGLNDDTRYIQISAPVQPGNSGGPVLDRNGGVIGVVVSKLNVLKIAATTQDVAQNVNFAIKATVLMNFLDVNGVRYATSNATQPMASADLAEHAKAMSTLVRCDR